VLGLAAALAARMAFLLGLPAVYGADPYIRLFHRDQLVTEFFGRNWLPGFQSLVVLSYEMELGLFGVRLVTALLAAATVALCFAYGAARFGLACGAVFAFGVHTDPDFLRVAGAPYQEPLFFALAMAALLRFSRLPARPTLRSAAPVLALVLVACATRYEGLLLAWSFALALVADLRGRARDLRAVAPLVGTLALLPVAVLAGFALAVEGSWDSPRRFAHRPVGEYLGHIAAHLGSRPLLLVVAAAGLAASALRRRIGQRDLLAVHALAVGFVIVLLLWAPYLPPNNPRSHLIPSLWLCLHAGLAAQAAFDVLRERAPRARNLLGGALAGAAALFLVVDGDGAFGGDVARQARSHAPYRRIAESVDAVLGEGGVVMPGSRREHAGRPDPAVLRIFAYMHGSPERIHFRSDLRWVPAERVPAALARRGVEGVLIPPDGPLPWTERLEETLRQQGRAPHRVPLPRGYRMLRWSGPGAPDGGLTAAGAGPRTRSPRPRRSSPPPSGRGAPPGAAARRTPAGRARAGPRTRGTAARGARRARRRGSC